METRDLIVRNGKLVVLVVETDLDASTGNQYDAEPSAGELEAFNLGIRCGTQDALTAIQRRFARVVGVGLEVEHGT